MRTVIGGLAGFIAGSLGWWLGAHVGFATALILSVLAGGAGLYAGYRWFDANLK